MLQFFKGAEEKKPFTYPTITEVRKKPKNYIYWIIGGILVVIIFGLFKFLL